ncbi:MAG: hypothetical protein JSS61_03785 [Verrucomicrobia bacterium]|nr:hypothetical protein [Verrucomicrobiota bacterium]
MILANDGVDSHQEADPFLAQEMREAFSLNGSNVLKCLPLGCAEFGGFEEGMSFGNHQYPYETCLEMVSQVTSHWNGKMEDVYSMTALAHQAVQNPQRCLQFLKHLKDANCAVLIGNALIPPSLRKLLFGAGCQFVATPTRNSYFEIDRIERECLEKVRGIQGYKVIITSMGCSGRALQKRLWNQIDNVFFFDFGSLMDALCGWETRDWMHITHFDRDSFIKEAEQVLQDPPEKDNHVKIIAVSAIKEFGYEMRKEEYCTSLGILKNYGYHPYVIEACHPCFPSYLDDFSDRVVYSNVNDYSLHNQGVNETRSLIEGLKHYQFREDDMVVKLTGRYRFTSPYFLELLEAHPEYDAVIRCDEGYPIFQGKAFAGCFAMKYSLFHEMLYSIDQETMEKEMIDFEVEVARFAKRLIERGYHVHYIDHLDMKANIGGSVPPVITNW